MEALLSLLLPLVFVLLVLAMVRTPRKRGGGRVPANPPPPPKSQIRPPLPPRVEYTNLEDDPVDVARRLQDLRSPDVDSTTRSLKRVYDESLAAIEGEDAAWKREVELSLLRHDSEKLDRIRKMVVGTFDASGRVEPMEAYISFMQIADEFVEKR